MQYFSDIRSDIRMELDMKKLFLAALTLSMLTASFGASAGIREENDAS
jgi:hypothetical protein